jgi:CRP/FNR family transcriptional regulator
LPPAALQRLGQACELRQHAADTHLFEEGEAPRGVFLILGGTVRVSRLSREGREQVLHEEGAGATLGEVPVFDGKGYVGTAIVSADAAVLFVPRRVLLAEVAAHPPSSAAVIAVLAARVRRFAALAADVSLRTVDERVARFLLDAPASAGGLVELPGTRERWAAELGTVREQVSRALSTLQRAGAIRVAGRRVTIVDRARLVSRLAAGR